jgi:cysteine desulfurase / selenocysteine lyase
MIYLDNAATSWPKPEGVLEAMGRCLRDVGASSGRSAHRFAQQAERIRLDAREAVAELLGIPNPLRIIFALNATTAINLVLHGLLPPGSHAVTSGMEHNAVARPLGNLGQQGVSVSVVPCQEDGLLLPEAIEEHLRADTRLVILNHASNVCGTVQPLREIALRAHARGIPVLVDAAQTAGCWPVAMEADGIDLLAFSGHKGLLGPTGTGGLAISRDFDTALLPSLIQGGTGSRSEKEAQPEILPDKYEAGTPNTVGLAGLATSVSFVLDRGVEQIREHERCLTQRLIDGLRSIPGVRVFGACDARRQTACVAFTIDGRSVSDVAQTLDEQFGILCRAGLHCAPGAHRTLGTFPHGTLRFAPGPFTTPAEIEQSLDAVSRIAGASARG